MAEARVDVRGDESGALRIVLSGDLDAVSVPPIWKDLSSRLSPPPRGGVTVDASSLDRCDGAGLALLQALRSGILVPGVEARLDGLSGEDSSRLVSLPDAATLRAATAREETGVVASIGQAAAAAGKDIADGVTFVGSVAAAFGSALAHPRLFRAHEVAVVFESAGVSALPIVSAMSFLVGLIIAFEAAQPLRQFGAEVFTANMVGIVMVRELGPLMTAIILAGRSGSAFAAELGTMKVNEELDALSTMGLDPVRFLVLQRVTAAALLSPVLSAWAMALGVGGGVLVMEVMGFPLSLIYEQMAMTVAVGDILTGLVKGLVFGLLVSSIGCLRGLQTGKGAAAVGASTTRAVVGGIVLVILADAVFSVLWDVLGG